MRQQQYAVLVLFALIIASSLTSFGCYSCMSRRVNEDMNRALTLTMQEQQSDVICQDTIRTFNNHLQIADLRGKATLAVETRGKRFTAYAHCSEATIFSLSDQRPAILLFVLSGFWAMFMWYKRQQAKISTQPLTIGENGFGGLTYSETDDLFYAADGQKVDLTPMQHQLMEMFFLSPTHSLSKKEICDSLWPKKPDANDTLYTLIRRLKPIIEQHSTLKIESNRGKAYQLKIR
jgi:hypothetical protein